MTNCNKLFNGKSVFGVRGSLRQPIQIGAIVIDDAHKCLDIIRESFSINIMKQNENGINPIYEQLWNIFEDSLRRQAPGTCNDIIDGENCLMMVPFWTWHDNLDEVLKILSEHKEKTEILFVWDLIKDHLSESVCIFSGDRLEITPRLLPIDSIPSFSEVKRRIFLSATLSEDAFLVRDMGISSESVINPLNKGDVEYSGERLILLPSLVDINLQRIKLISWINSFVAKRGTFGAIAITPSFRLANLWETHGANVTNVRRLYDNIDDLKVRIKNKVATDFLVLVNVYDGVDLPDSTCRILVLDSLPSYTTLMDRYLQEISPFSGILRRKIAQRVEQGMGRAIRGSSDWCIVVIIGNNITNFLSEESKRKFLSNEAQLQIKIGEELVKIMKTEGGHISAIENLINQCIRRDDGWKEFYKNRMSDIKPEEYTKEHLDRSLSERTAEIFYRQGQCKRAADTLQNVLDKTEQADKGWFLQLIATYTWPIDRKQSMDIQLKAHMENSRLLRPERGITYSKLTATGTRESRILDWITKYESHNSMLLETNRVIDTLRQSTPSNSFEQGICELGEMLGFVSDRPEQKTGEGPDNLWNIRGKRYWFIECKNRVKSSRSTISKKEAGQLSNSIGWFKEYYGTEDGLPILIHPSKKLASGAFIMVPFWVMTRDNLKKFRNNTRQFFTSISTTPFDSLSEQIISQKLKEHNLDTNVLQREYLQRGE